MLEAEFLKAFQESLRTKANISFETSDGLCSKACTCGCNSDLNSQIPFRLVFFMDTWGVYKSA